MGRETILFKSEEKKDIAGVAVFLRELADKLIEGRVVLQGDSESVTLEIPSTVEMEVKAELEEGRAKTKKKLEVEIEWVVGQESGKAAGSVRLG